MQCSLTRRGYSIRKGSLSKDELDALRRELTVTPVVAKDYAAMCPPRPFPVFAEDDDAIVVPKNFGLERFGVANSGEHDLATGAREVHLTFRGQLRPEQEEPAKRFLEACEDPARMGGILNLPCAFGKTALAIYLVCRLARKALVIVHKEFLLEQWKERIAQFCPDARIGCIRGKCTDVRDKDIVIGLLQSISMKDYDPSVYAEFGMVVVDECHRTAAEVFSRALRKVVFRYSLGLSATINRKDGLSKVFLWHLGKVAYAVTKRTDQVDVLCKSYYDENPAYSRECLIYNGKTNVSRMINNICDHEPRCLFIKDALYEVFVAEPERKVLLLSDRRSHLFKLRDLFERHKVGKSVGMYMGGMAQDELKKSEQCQVILGTYQISHEGLDIRGLDTLVLASPKTDVVQATGRILRDKPEERKHVPLIIDVIDEFSLFKGQSMRRLKYYKSCGYNLIRMAEDDGAPESNKSKFSLDKLEAYAFVDED